MSQADLVQIAITKEAYRAVERTIEKAAPGAPQMLTDGRVHIRLPKRVLNAMTDLRHPGEDYSGLIIRITQELGQ